MGGFRYKNIFILTTFKLALAGIKEVEVASMKIKVGRKVVHGRPLILHYGLFVIVISNIMNGYCKFCDYLYSSIKTDFPMRVYRISISNTKINTTCHVC